MAQVRTLRTITAQIILKNSVPYTSCMSSAHGPHGAGQCGKNLSPPRRVPLVNAAHFLTATAWGPATHIPCLDNVTASSLIMLLQVSRHCSQSVPLKTSLLQVAHRPSWMSPREEAKSSEGR